MKHHRVNVIAHIFLTATIFVISSAVLVPSVIAQSYAVHGVISTSTGPVRYASVTFFDKIDSTRRITVQTDTSGRYSLNILTSVGSLGAPPAQFQLEQNYPNPFASSTAISYQLDKSADVTVTVYDILGREIRKFTMGEQSAGTHGIVWDGRNNLGITVAKGVYFCQLQAKGETQIKKMIFGIGNSSVVLAPPRIVQSISPEAETAPANTLSTTFTVQIQSTDTTFPAIVAQQIENVNIASVSTLDITVIATDPFSDLNRATIYPDNPRQVIRGFGAASPWYLPTMTNTEVDIAFGAAQGQLDFSILRLTIEPDSSGWAKWVPSAKRAQDIGAIVIASPWYAPTSLVETVSGNVSRVRHDKYADYAAHLNAYNAFMNRNGVSIYGISMQNEPDITGQWTSWTSAEMLTFVKTNASAIKGTKIMAPESFQFSHDMTDPILNDSAACAITDIICGHLYGTGLTTYPVAAQKGKEVWMTEHLMGENNSGNNWPWAMTLAKEISDVMKADMSAYVWWTLVRYYGPIGDGQKATSPQDPTESYPAKDQVTKKGYVLTQFARFVRPGFNRVWSTDYSARSLVDVTAYRNGSRLVLVAINRNSTATNQTFIVWNGSAGAFTPYVTSSTKNCEQQANISYKNGMFTYPLAPLSVTTFVLN